MSSIQYVHAWYSLADKRLVPKAPAISETDTEPNTETIATSTGANDAQEVEEHWCIPDIAGSFRRGDEVVVGGGGETGTGGGGCYLQCIVGEDALGNDAALKESGKARADGTTAAVTASTMSQLLDRMNAPPSAARTGQTEDLLARAPTHCHTGAVDPTANTLDKVEYAGWISATDALGKKLRSAWLGFALLEWNQGKNFGSDADVASVARFDFFDISAKLNEQKVTRCLYAFEMAELKMRQSQSRHDGRAQRMADAESIEERVDKLAEEQQWTW